MKKIKTLIKRINAKVRKSILTKIESHLTEQDRLQLQRNGTFYSLQRLAKSGYKPSHIIDIGAYIGSWSVEAHKIFPDAKFIAIEPLPDKKNILEKAFMYMPVKMYNVLLGDSKKKNVRFYTAGTGSSVLKELTNFSTDANSVYLDMYTLDEITAKENVEGNIVLKIDVQGFETEVLKGAVNTLKHVDFICMEVSFLNYNEGAPLAHEIIPFMSAIGFLIYDITGFIRKSNDYALIQSDIIFIKETHPLRKKINNLNEDFYVMY